MMYGSEAVCTSLPATCLTSAIPTPGNTMANSSPPEPAERIFGTQAKSEPMAERLQQRVAGLVAETIVDRFELIEIDIENTALAGIAELAAASCSKPRRFSTPVNGSRRASASILSSLRLRCVISTSVTEKSSPTGSATTRSQLSSSSPLADTSKLICDVGGCSPAKCCNNLSAIQGLELFHGHANQRFLAVTDETLGRSIGEDAAELPGSVGLIALETQNAV